jgi:hypothetical protein
VEYGFWDSPLFTRFTKFPSRCHRSTKFSYTELLSSSKISRLAPLSCQKSIIWLSYGIDWTSAYPFTQMAIRQTTECFSKDQINLSAYLYHISPSKTDSFKPLYPVWVDTVRPVYPSVLVWFHGFGQA